MTEHNIVVGIKGNPQGGQTVKKTLDDIASSNDKAAAAAKRLEVQNQKSVNSETRLAAETKRAEAATVSASAAMDRSAASKRKSQAAALSAAAAEAKAATEMRRSATAALNAASAQLKAENAMRRSQSAADKLSNSQSNLNQKMAAGSNYASMLRNSFVALAAGFFIKEAIQADMKLDQLNNRMRASAKDSNIAALGMEFARETADKLGLKMQSTADGFAGFSAASLRAGLDFGTTKQIFEDVATAATSLQLPADRVALVFKALEQIASKGTVSMEELKQQLGESLPGALQLGAKAMNMTNAAFIEAVSSGEIMSKEFLPAFGAAIREELGGSAATAATQMLAETNRMSSAFFDLQTEFSKNGAGQAYTEVVREMSAVFRDPDFRNGITAVSGLIFDLTMKVIDATKALNNFFGITRNGELEKINNRIENILSNPDSLDWTSLKSQSWTRGGRRQERQEELKELEARRQQMVKVAEAERIFANSKSEHAKAQAQLKAAMGGAKGADGYVIGGTETEKSKAQKKAESDAAKKAGKEQKAIQKDLTDAFKASRTEQEKLMDTIQEMERLKPFAKTAEEANAIAKNIANAKKEMDELKIKAEVDSPLGKAFKALASEIDDSLKDAFVSSFEKGEMGFEAMVDGMKASFKRMLAELAYMALVKPIVVSILGTTGGAAGLSEGSLSQLLGTGGNTGAGGFSLSNIGSTLSSFMNGGLYSNTLGGIGSGVGNVLSGQAWGAMGPSKAAAIGGGAFGNLGYGALGSLAGNLLGLGSQNSTVNMLSGTVGSLAGGAIGTSLGTILGMAGGPLGAALGGLAGTAIGGLFGGGMPRQTIGGLLGSNGEDYKISNLSNKGSDNKTAKSFLQQISDAVEQFQALVDFDLGKNIGIQSNIGKKDPKTLVDKVKVSGKGGDVGAVLKAILSQDKYVSGGDSDLMSVMRKSLGKNSDINQVLSDVQFAKSVYELIDPKKIDPVADALKAINEEFDTMVKRATDLGLPLDELTKALDKQREETISLVKAQQAGFSTMEAMTDAFKSFFDIQSLSDSSSLTPEQKLKVYQDNFDGLLKTAQGGDLTVTTKLLQSAQELIDASRTVNASSTTFAMMEEFVRSSVREIAKAAGVPGYAGGTLSAGEGLAMVGERGRELVQLSGGERVFTAGETAGIMAGSGNISSEIVKTNYKVVALLEENNSEMAEMRRENRALRKQIERLANKVAVGAI